MRQFHVHYRLQITPYINFHSSVPESVLSIYRHQNEFMNFAVKIGRMQDRSDSIGSLGSGHKFNVSIHWYMATLTYLATGCQQSAYIRLTAQQASNAGLLK